jgi:acyl-coenzyme A thioesterase PaaI-like protein
MSVVAPLSRLLPSVDTHGNPIRDAWDRMHTLPGGKALFTRMIGTMAPYTGSMGARVEELGRGFSRVTLPDRRPVRNHLRCIHAIALANLAELTGNVALAYTLPDDARFIVAGMSIEYLKKARGNITGECECPLVESSERREFQVPVTMKNPAGEVVATATLRTLVGPKQAG